MFCMKCGKELDSNSTFCMYCGEKITSSDDAPAVSADAPAAVKTAPPRKKRKGLAAFLIILVVLVALGTAGYKLWQSPQVQMYLAIQKDNYDLAYEIFDDNFYPEDLSARTIELLNEKLTEANDGFLAGTLTYDDVYLVTIQVEYFGVESLEESIQAIRYSADLQKAINDYVSEAELAMESGDYFLAWDLYLGALEIDPDNDAIQECVWAAADACKQDYLDRAEHYASIGEFDSAYNELSTAEYYFPDHPEIPSLREQITQQQLDAMAQEAHAAADGGDWDGALELLDEYQAIYPTAIELQEAREQILWEMPITLENLTLINSNRLDIYEAVVTDRWGNAYDGGTRINGCYEGFALYNLDGKFTAFSATVFPTSDTNQKSVISLAVYLDEVLIQYVDNITVETVPFTLDLDVSGTSTLRLVVSSNNYSSSYLCIGGSSFTKAEQ